MIRLRSLVWAGLAVFVAVIALACSGGQMQLRSEDVDTTTMPPDVLASYRVFQRRCSKCHALARVYDSGIIDDDFWVRYVARMRRQPGSGITKNDEAVVLHYLYYYSAQKRDAGTGPRPDVTETKAENAANAKAAVVPAPLSPSSSAAPVVANPVNSNSVNANPVSAHPANADAADAAVKP